jgi:hypothetical protein
MPKKPHNYSKKGSQSLNKHTYSLTMQLKTERQSTKSKASSKETKKFNTLNYAAGRRQKLISNFQEGTIKKKTQKESREKCRLKFTTPIFSPLEHFK